MVIFTNDLGEKYIPLVTLCHWSSAFCWLVKHVSPTWRLNVFSPGKNPSPTCTFPIPLVNYCIEGPKSIQKTHRGLPNPWKLLPGFSKWPFDRPNGGHLTLEKVTYNPKKIRVTRKNLVLFVLLLTPHTRRYHCIIPTGAIWSPYGCFQK